MHNFFQVLLTPFRVLFVELPFKIIQAPRRLVGLSVPARVAVMVSVFLIICVVTVAVAYRLEPSNVPWHDFLTTKRVLAILALMVAIPIVVYKALQLWLEGEVSRFPDIDYAWKTGMGELQNNGIDLTQTPLFLILGVSDAMEKSVVESARLRLRIREIPAGPAALHWYASPEAVYLFCSETSCLSKLVAAARKIEAEGPSLRPELVAAAGPNIRGTIVPGGEQGLDSLRMSSDAPESQSRPSIRGTMVVGGGAETDDVASAGVPEKAMAHLDPQVAAEQSLRLAYLCQLIHRAREPLCPLNGLLTMLPYNLIKVGPGGARELQKAVRTDLETLSSSLKLRCPTSAIISGMEREDGFCELVRRVGLERAGAQRFGKGFGVWNPPIPEQLEAVCAHACGAFEDWVYSLFKEKGSLEKVGNKKLYSLLCSVRRDIKDRLTNLVVAAYGHESQPKAGSDAQLFSGCYFAATGDVEFHQAFLRGVFDKLIEQQEEVEWSHAAIAEDRRYLNLAYYAIALDALLLVALAGMIGYIWFR